MTDREFSRRLWRSVGAVIVTAAIVAVLWVAREALVLIYISVLLAIGFGPFVHAIEHSIENRATARGRRRRVPRWLAILAIYLAIVGTLTVVGLLVVPPLVQQAQDLWVQRGRLFESVQTFLVDKGLLDHPLTLQEAVMRAPGTPGGAVGTLAGAVTQTVKGIFGAVTVLILTFYLLLESKSLFAAFARLFPIEERPRVEETASKISEKVSAWLSGQLILAGTIGTSAAIALYLLGVPYFYILALIAAIGEIIPVVGPVLSAIPAVLVGFTMSVQTGLLVLAFYFVQQQIENHLLVPKIMSHQVGVSAVMVIVALLIGASVLGILGAILAIPTAAIVQVVAQELLDARDRGGALSN